VLNAPVIKPFDGATVLSMARGSRLVITAENHTIIGGLGSAVAEVLAEAGLPVPLRRIGIADTFAEAGSREYLFAKYGLGTQDIVSAAWDGLKINRPPPQARIVEVSPGDYAPV
jgi:transketolase